MAKGLPEAQPELHHVCLTGMCNYANTLVSGITGTRANAETEIQGTQGTGSKTTQASSSGKGMITGPILRGPRRTESEKPQKDLPGGL